MDGTVGFINSYSTLKQMNQKTKHKNIKSWGGGKKKKKQNTNNPHITNKKSIKFKKFKQVSFYNLNC